MLEKFNNNLARLLERDGPGLLDLVALLFNLHQKFDPEAADLSQTMELMNLRFGEEEVTLALKKCQLK